MPAIADAESVVGKIWFVSQVFGRHENSTGHLLAQLTEAVALDHRVEVVAPAGQAERQSPERSGQILRAGQATVQSIVLGWRALRKVRAGDVVVALTNPPALPVVLAFVAALRRARLIVIVHDVYPEALYAAEPGAGHSLIARVFDRLNGMALKAADRVIVIGRDMECLLRNKLGAEHSHLEYIPNWPDVTTGPEPTVRAARTEAQPLVVQYSGKLGATHNPELLATAAELMTEGPAVRLQVFSWGSGLEVLRQRIKGRSLTNVEICEPCAREDLGRQLSTCDIGLILMRPGMAGVSVPCRLYNLLAAGKPMIVAAEAHSEIAMVVREARIGWVVAPDDPASLVDAIFQAESDRDALVEMGQRARTVAQEQFSFERALDRYRRVLGQVAALRA